MVFSISFLVFLMTGFALGGQILDEEGDTRYISIDPQDPRYTIVENYYSNEGDDMKHTFVDLPSDTLDLIDEDRKHTSKERPRLNDLIVINGNSNEGLNEGDDMKFTFVDLPSDTLKLNEKDKKAIGNDQPPRRNEWISIKGNSNLNEGLSEGDDMRYNIIEDERPSPPPIRDTFHFTEDDFKNIIMDPPRTRDAFHYNEGDDVIIRYVDADELSMMPVEEKVYLKLNEGDDMIHIYVDQSPPPKKFRWPEVVSMTGEAAKAFIESDNPDLNVEIVQDGQPVTMDYRTNRVRIFVNSRGIVENAPVVG